jgi:hypothetical protein
VFAHSDKDHAPFITAIESAVALNSDTLSKNPLRLKVAVQPNSVDCGFHVPNVRSLTKSMLDRDEDSTTANLEDGWQPPSSALPEVRQSRAANAASS